MPSADRHVSWRAKNDADSSAAKDERAAQQQGRLAAFATSDAFARAEKSKRLKKHRKREQQQQQQQQQQQLQPRGLAKLGALGRYPTTITPALKTSWQVEALLEPARSAVDVLYAKSFLLLPPERPPPRLPVRAFRRIRRRWRRVVALVVGRARRGSHRRRRFFDGWRGWLAETVVRSVLRSAGDHTILRAAVEKLRGGYLTFAWERWTATGDRRKDWYYTHHTQPFSRLISLRTRAPTSARKAAIEAATTELLVARTEPMTWVACHSCAGCLRKQRCTKLLDISGSRPMASHFVWRLWQLIGGGLNTCSGGLSDRRKKALAALIRPDQGIPTLKRSIARHVHFEESYTDQHWRALQSKLQGNKNATTRRPPLWTRRQMHFRRSAGRSKEGPIANRKAREEASAAQDEAFRSCLPSHAREAFEAKLEAERSRALDRRRREKRWRRWREEHAPSAILASCQDALEERVDDWRALRRQRKAIAQARREAARRRAEAAAAARLAARRQEQRLMFGEDAAAHRLRWMMQSGDDWWNSASDDERKGGDDDDDEEEENNSLFDWGVPNDKKLLNDITQLDFRARGSSPDAWKVFFERALPLYVKLKVLDLSDNGELNIDIAELVGRLPPTLKELRLNGTQCFGDGRSAAWDALPKLKRLNMTGTAIKGTKEELLTLLPSDCRVYPGLPGLYATKELDYRKKGWVAVLWTRFVEEELPQREGLEVLRLAGNKELEADIVTVVEKCPTTVKKLFLDGTSCHGKGLKAPWERLVNLEMVNLTGTKVTGSEEDLRAVLPASCKRVYAAEDGWDL